MAGLTISAGAEFLQGQGELKFSRTAMFFCKRVIFVATLLLILKDRSFLKAVLK